MLTFVVDDPAKGFQNLCPLFADNLYLTEPWEFPKWLDHYNIKYNTVTIENATKDSWYPVAINFWDFSHDYLKSLPSIVLKSLSEFRVRLLFYYREADDPGRIRQHINEMCSWHRIDPDLILFISGNTAADKTPGTVFFWHFDTDYYFQTMHSTVPTINADVRPRKITCLSRIKKNWREYFIYNICRYADLTENFISYGNHMDAINYRDEDFVMWGQDNLNFAPEILASINESFDVTQPTNSWLASLPLRVDEMSAEQHNNHSIVVDHFFQESYWNVVLETMIATESEGDSVFITEKTLKPIRNGQSFVVVGCRGTLKMLEHHGYQTFGDIIDENYDNATDVRERWYKVFQLAKKFLKSSKEDLHKLQQDCLPVIQHNQSHFFRSRKPALMELVDKLCHQ
jgi:hypothetical protein